MPSSANNLLEHERAEFRVRAMKRRESRDTRLRELGFRDYDAYINSSSWRKRREEYWSNPATLKECGICATSESPLPLHHKTYERVGEERLDDLVPVCAKCHMLVHALDQRGDLDIDADFSQLVDNKRAAEFKASAKPSDFNRELSRELKQVEAKLVESRKRLKKYVEKGKNTGGLRAATRQVRGVEKKLRFLRAEIDEQSGE